MEMVIGEKYTKMKKIAEIDLDPNEINNNIKIFYKNKKVLVTGAGGFIGSHLVEELVKLGANVRAFVHYNSRNDWGLLEYLPKDIKENIEVVSGDIQDPFFVLRSTKDIEIVFHLAALISIPFSYVSPQIFVKVNTEGTLNVMEACLRSGVKRVVHTSTSEIYGTAQYVPIDEKHPLNPQSPYAASKLGADKIAESYYLSFELPVVILRPFNTFGPRQSARAVIPTIITQFLTMPQIKLGSKEPVRDLNYVEDTVRGFLLAGMAKNIEGEVINIGTGVGFSVNDILESIFETFGRRKPVITDEQRIRPEKSEVMKLICDCSKANKMLGWLPNHSLREGLIKTIRWIENNLPIYKADLYNI